MLLQSSYIYFIYLIVVFRRTQHYFAYTTAANTMVGGNQAVPAGNPPPCTGCCQISMFTSQLSQHKSDIFEHLWLTFIRIMFGTVSTSGGFCSAQRNLTSLVFPHPVSPITMTGMPHLHAWVRTQRHIHVNLGNCSRKKQRRLSFILPTCSRRRFKLVLQQKVGRFFTCGVPWWRAHLLKLVSHFPKVRLRS